MSPEITQDKNLQGSGNFQTRMLDESSFACKYFFVKINTAFSESISPIYYKKFRVNSNNISHPMIQSSRVVDKG